MAQNITWLGSSYVGVEGIDLPRTGGGTARFADPSPITSIASDVTSGKVYMKADGSLGTGTNSGGGGGGGPVLLNTTSLGTVNTTSTQASSLNISLSVSGVNNYDLLIVESSVNTLVANRHACTVGLIFLTGSSTIATKNGGAIATMKLNIKCGSSTGTHTSVQGTTAYGIYPNSVSVSSGTATIPMYRRYNSTSTGTINGTYTARVYGVNLNELIGG